jgi:hypothetical protein
MADILTNLGWPHFTFIFAVIFILVFKKPLYSFISRVKSIDKTGVKTSAAPEAQREEDKKEAVQDLLDVIGSSIVLKDLENRIKSDLHERGLESKGDTNTILIKHLAAARILLRFEQIHNFIFGSQIFLLKKLNEVAGQGMPKEFIDSHYQHVQELFSKQLGGWSLEQYLSFLLGRSLITISDNIYHITHFGVEYLTWIVRNGRREDNPL